MSEASQSQVDFYSSTVALGPGFLKILTMRNADSLKLTRQTSQAIWMGGKGKMDIHIRLNTVAINL